MKHQVMADVDTNITIIQQDLIQRFGLITAAVFGRIQMYCQMEDGVCNASMETIGGELGLDRATCYRHARKLCEEGFLEDLTPDLRNHPHTYRDTGKAGLTISISGYSGVAENNTNVAQRNTSVAENNTRKNGQSAGVAQRNTKMGKNGSGVAQRNTEASGVAENHMNNVVVVKQTLKPIERKQQQEARGALIQAGISAQKATQLANDYDPDRIQTAIDVYNFMRHFRKAHGSGYLVSFLENEWSPPAEYIPPDDRCPDCWNAANEHDPECPQYRSHRDSYICPYCHSYPCSCEAEEESEEESSA